jgi:hypothetical protein
MTVTPTDPTGATFISYRRSRADDVAVLARAFGDRGIPTWVDTRNLRAEPTAGELRRVLGDPRTSAGVMWLTADVAGSATILNVEAPAIASRYDAGDGFWVQPVAAGGLGYVEAAAVVAGHFVGDDLAHWNIQRVDSDPLASDDARAVACRCLHRRLAAIHDALADGEPVTMTVHARGTPAPAAGIALEVDWTPHFQDPYACDDWPAVVAAARDIAEAVRIAAPGRDVVASGTPAMPAAVLLGTVFPTRDSATLRWRQRHTDGTLDATGWSAADASSAEIALDAGWCADFRMRDPAAGACAVLVNVSDDVNGAFDSSRADLPAWRAIVRVTHKARQPRRDLTGVEAASLARLVTETIRDARSSCGPFSSVHLFLAAPAGFALSLGSMLATLPEVVAYEFDNARGQYRRAFGIVP